MQFRDRATMSENNGFNPWEMAQAQLAAVAERIDLDRDVYKMLTRPRRELILALPVLVYQIVMFLSRRVCSDDQQVRPGQGRVVRLRDVQVRVGQVRVV